MTGSGTAVSQSERDFVESNLSKLDMVDWDRFTVGRRPDEGREITVYGWIDRDDDEYKDFVVLQFYPETEEKIVAFTTSSERYTGEICRRLYDIEPDEHYGCRRVEDTFDVENAIELEDNASLEEFA